MNLAISEELHETIHDPCCSAVWLFKKKKTLSACWPKFWQSMASTCQTVLVWRCFWETNKIWSFQISNAQVNKAKCWIALSLLSNPLLDNSRFTETGISSKHWIHHFANLGCLISQIHHCGNIAGFQGILLKIELQRLIISENFTYTYHKTWLYKQYIITTHTYSEKLEPHPQTLATPGFSTTKTLAPIELL